MFVKLQKNAEKHIDIVETYPIKIGNITVKSNLKCFFFLNT